MQTKKGNIVETLVETDDKETNFSEEQEYSFELPTITGKEALDITKGAET